MYIRRSSCRNDRFEILMTRGAQTKVRPYNFFKIKIIYMTKQPYYTVQDKKLCGRTPVCEPARVDLTDGFKRGRFNPRPEIKTR